MNDYTAEDNYVNNDIFRDTDNIKSEAGPALVALDPLTVVMRDGEDVGKWDGTPGTAIGVTFTTAAIGEEVLFWTGGHFHQHKLVWPAIADTINKRKAAFDGQLLAAS